MPIDNLHRKLFQDNGRGATLRSDIIPWDNYPYAAEVATMLSAHTTTTEPIPSGTTITTCKCGYVPGTSSLMVFLDGLMLDEGTHYSEGSAGCDGYARVVTLLFDCAENCTLEFVVHGGVTVDELAITSCDFPTAVTEEDWVGTITYVGEGPVEVLGLPDGMEYVDSGGRIEFSWCPEEYGDFEYSVRIVNEGGQQDCIYVPLPVEKGFYGFKYTVDPSLNSETYYTYFPLTLDQCDGLIVDWGDGTVEQLSFNGTSASTEYPTHQYDVTGGPYQISVTLPGDDTYGKVFGNVYAPVFGAYTQSYSVQAEELAERAPRTFSAYTGEDTTGCHVHGLLSIDSPFPVIHATSFANLFHDNKFLERVPHNLFKFNKEATSFKSAFKNTYSLEEVPKGLFDGCTEVTTFNGCFDSSGVTTLPEDLFKDCGKATDFKYCFYNTPIVALQKGMFAGCTSVDEFDYCFQYCGYLVSMPEDLFADCVNCTSLFYVFTSCSSDMAFTLDLTNVNNVGWANSFAYGSGDASNNIVKVTAGSTTEASFQKRDDTNVTLESV